MDINRLTEKSQEALAQAQNVAVSHGHVEIDGEHLLMALLDQEGGLLPRLLARMEAPVDQLRNRIEDELQKRPKVGGPGAEPRRGERRGMARRARRPARAG